MFGRFAFFTLVTLSFVSPAHAEIPLKTAPLMTALPTAILAPAPVPVTPPLPSMTPAPGVFSCSNDNFPVVVSGIMNCPTIRTLSFSDDKSTCRDVIKKTKAGNLLTAEIRCHLNYEFQSRPGLENFIYIDKVTPEGANYKSCTTPSERCPLQDPVAFETEYVATAVVEKRSCDDIDPGNECIDQLVKSLGRKEVGRMYEGTFPNVRLTLGLDMTFEKKAIQCCIAKPVPR